MAKRRRSMVGPAEWRPPSPQERVKMHAKDMAQAAVEAHPRVQRMRDEIEEAVMRAARHVENPGRTKRGGNPGHARRAGLRPS